MNKATFREKLARHINTKLDDGELDDDLTFSEFWTEVRDYVDYMAEDEDIEEHEREKDDSEDSDDYGPED